MPLTFLLSLTLSASAQDLQSVDKQALQSHAYEWLQELTDTIGPRLTGSPQATKAIDWATRKMQQIGLQNVHSESWQLKRGWQRGVASASLLSPIPLAIPITSYGWTGATPSSGVESDLVLVNRNALADEMARNASKWRGRILFLAPLGPKPADPLRAIGELSTFVEAAQSAHAAAVICRDSRPGMMLTHTGPVGFSDKAFSIPVVDITNEHQILIQRLLESKTPVRMRMNVSAKFSAAPILSSNVIGEIRGVEHPEQIVIVGAHLDSWDLGTGAIDDGTGVAAVLGAAEAILRSGTKPKRTIRFILFTGEEQGLLGSLAYVRQHEAEMSNIVCALVLDWGQGPITTVMLAGHEELRAGLQPITERIGTMHPLRLGNGFLTFTDAYSFTLAGVPGLAFLQQSNNYTMIGHSSADTLDKVDGAVLLANTSVVAMTAFALADHPERLGMVWSKEETARRLTDAKERPLLELFGLWPFSK